MSERKRTKPAEGSDLPLSPDIAVDGPEWTLHEPVADPFIRTSVTFEADVMRVLSPAARESNLTFAEFVKRAAVAAVKAGISID